MPTRPQKFYRHSIRLPDYDYSQPGFYYVTICARDKKLMFGEIANGEIYLNEAGSIVQAVWSSMPERFPYVKLDEYTIMPNHMHGIIELLESDVDRVNSANRPAQSIVSERSVINPLSARKRAVLGDIVRAFKGATTHYIRTKVRPDFAWQEDYYEHIVRNDRDLERIRKYIFDNPARWESDRFFV